MTHVLTLLPILAALVFTDNQINLPNIPWDLNTEGQIIFMNACWQNRDRLLSENNFDKTIEPVHKQLDDTSEGIHLYSQVELVPKWQIPGERIKFPYFNHEFDGVFLEKQKVDNRYNFNVYKLENHSPVVAIRAEKNDVVYLTIAHKALKDFALFEHINHLRDALKEERIKKINYHQISFPMITIDVQPDISWMCGMIKDEWVITQAMQHVYFALNEHGVEKQHSSREFHSTYLPKAQKDNCSYTIQQPFFMWMERPGVEIPLVMAYVDIDSWHQA